MTNINPFAFFLGLFLGGNKQKKIDFEKVDILHVENILTAAKYAQNEKAYDWEDPGFVKKMNEINRRYKNSNPSTSIHILNI